MKQFIIAGNWKMNTNEFEAVKLCQYIIEGLDSDLQNIKILVCPPFINIPAVSKTLGKSGIFIGAQNCHYEINGAFTGEISIPMLVYFNCSYIILGHSERRHLFHEADDIINKKVKSVLDNDVLPVLCIGETLIERQENRTFEIIENQIKGGLAGVDNNLIKNVVIAYEPVWAIGTGISATVEQIAEAHHFIHRKLTEYYGESGKSILILYGGSVTAENSHAILDIDYVNGALIGGASLKGDTFRKIIKDAIMINRDI